MTLTEIRAALAELGMRPVKTLGQNFLHDQNLARWIVDQLELGAADHVIEIGPGLGALTEYLAPRCRSMEVIEKDGKLAARLSERFAGTNVGVRHMDATRFDARELFPKQPVKVVGNLPYYVSTPLLFLFAGEPSAAGRLVFTLQKELARRLSAGPSTHDYGALTLILQRRWRVEYLRTLPPQVFFPEPAVESAVVRLTARDPGELPACDGAVFERLVKLGFSQRRKQLRKLHALDHWPKTAETIGVPETVRAEALALEQWIQLANLSTGQAAMPAQDVHGEQFDVVDAQDEVTGQASRHEVHTGGLMHRAVHILIFNEAGELFLQKRSPWKDAHPSRWDSSAAGHVNTAGTYEETAHREVAEELGVTVALDEIATIPPSTATGWEHVRLFAGKHEGPFRLPPAEIECGAFFPIALIRRWIEARPENFATGFLECFKAWERKQTACANKPL